MLYQDHGQSIFDRTGNQISDKHQTMLAGKSQMPIAYRWLGRRKKLGGGSSKKRNVLSMNVLLKQQAMHLVMQIGRHKIHGMKLIQTLMIPSWERRRESR